MIRDKIEINRNRIAGKSIRNRYSETRAIWEIMEIGLE
ncbi:hypothetical protein A33Q_2106 [Indibacter alkaliphilus LW1]|uniref:Uncharacterized protein n=1 Tax=Indibacter alkaliphilus (strain CCUG 57479 / KCTC 22604 / LW1) TaxID=1189612 RepID=S2DXG0_INDAL|nr:hypothetical protein A33Q_2106 [Indibacter alkaliphilus LW1]